MLGRPVRMNSLTLLNSNPVLQSLSRNCSGRYSQRWLQYALEIAEGLKRISPGASASVMRQVHRTIQHVPLSTPQEIEPWRQNSRGLVTAPGDKRGSARAPDGTRLDIMRRPTRYAVCLINQKAGVGRVWDRSRGCFWTRSRRAETPVTREFTGLRLRPEHRASSACMRCDYSQARKMIASPVSNRSDSEIAI